MSMAKFFTFVSVGVTIACVAFSQDASESTRDVDNLLDVVTSDRVAEAARVDALGKLSALLWRDDIDIATKRRALVGVLELLDDGCPAALTVASLHTLKTLGYEKTVPVVAVVCDAAERPAEVRLAALDAIAEIGGVASIPTLFNALRDKDPQVVARADRLLEHECWTPRGDMEPARKWREFFGRDQGEKMLVASFAKLGSGIGGVHNLPSRGLPAHVASFVMDDQIGDAAWQGAYEYMCACVERRFVEDPKAGRKQLAAAVREWWESLK